MQFDIIGLGEALIDLTDAGESPRGNDLLEANPGGGVANFLAMAAALGKRCAFIGKVEEDPFGRRMARALDAAGIDRRGLIFDKTHRTTLTVVHNAPDGERDFAFFRNPGADMFLQTEELDLNRLRSARALHYSSLSLTDEPARTATRRAVETAAEAGVLVSFDPNYRASLWQSPAQARKALWYGVEHCAVLKTGLDELLFLTEQREEQAAVESLRSRCNAGFITVTDGKNGARAYWQGGSVFVPARLRQDTVDCTGAGDAFGALVLSMLLDRGGLAGLDAAGVERILKSAAEAAALVTTHYGAFCAMAEAVRALAQ